MNQIIEYKSLDIESVKKEIDCLQNKIKFQAFGKTKQPTAKAIKRRLEKIRKSAQELDDQ